MKGLSSSLNPAGSSHRLDQSGFISQAICIMTCRTSVSKDSVLQVDEHGHPVDGYVLERALVGFESLLERIVFRLELDPATVREPELDDAVSNLDL